MSQSQIIFSESMEQQQNGPVNMLKVVNPILQINVPFLPTNYSFSMVALTSGIDFGKNHIIELKVENPDGKVLYSTGQQQIPPLPNTDNLNFNIDLKNIVFETAGSYKGRLIIDNQEATTNDLLVIKKSMV